MLIPDSTIIWNALDDKRNRAEHSRQSLHSMTISTCSFWTTAPPSRSLRSLSNLFLYSQVPQKALFLPLIIQRQPGAQNRHLGSSSGLSRPSFLHAFSFPRYEVPAPHDADKFFTGLVCLDFGLGETADDYRNQISFASIMSWFFSKLDALDADAPPELGTLAQQVVDSSSPEFSQSSAARAKVHNKANENFFQAFVAVSCPSGQIASSKPAP